MDQLTRRNLMRGAVLVGSAILLRDPALAQGHGPPQIPMHSPESGMGEYPFRFKAYGAYRNIMMKRNYAPVVGLQSVIDDDATDAVGALSGLRGEISIIDGRLIVSYGAGCGAGCSSATAETAMLLATAATRGWRPISVEKNLDEHATEAFIREQASANGLDETKPFPFRVNGTIIEYTMHVNIAPNPAFDGHGSHGEMVLTEVSEGARLAGNVVGFYAPPSLQGVITHMGDSFHSHYVSMDRTKTTHLDSFGIGAGTTILLPRV
jgi:acetolactate decarboxylase